ncbi:MAG TPA: hypothetical protein VIS03_20375, partial [Kiloniellaceae bacterium]
MPDAHDPARAEPWMERWRATAAAAPDPAVRDFAPSLAQSPEGQRLLQTIFANSPFLSHCLIADIGLLAAVLNLGPGGVLKNVLGTVKSTAAEAGDQADLMRSLRVCRRRAAFAVAFADIAGLWDVTEVTAALSDFADAVVEAALAA